MGERRRTIRSLQIMRILHLTALAASLLALGGCATRAVDVKPLSANPAEFATWGCDRIHDEQDAVQQRAADVAYTVDERSGNNIMALGLGVTVFWPALFAMRPVGLDAADLARLKGRFEALITAERRAGCPPAGADLPPSRTATLPVAQGDRLVYEDRSDARQPAAQWVLSLLALRRGEFEYRLEPGASGESGVWRQDRVGNVLASPPGSLQWPHLLRGTLALGDVTAGEVLITGDPLARARLRGQVVAVGPQLIAGRRFDVAVLDLFGDAQRGEFTTRVDGAIVVDRATGVLLRLDLRSAAPGFSLQRRLVRVDAASP
jgi:hypothetical protein